MTTRRRPAAAAAAAVAVPALPLTVTRPALLVDGSDRQFRDLLLDLMTLSQQLLSLRAALARKLGVSEPEYRVFIAIAQRAGETGIAVGAVARHLMVSGPFITAIANKLVARGFVEKRESGLDRRGVLLALTAHGRRVFAGFAAVPQAINDEAFRSLGPEDFAQLRDIVRRLVADGERALAVARLHALDDDAAGAG